MSEPLRIAVFVGAFPVLSETFIVRQINGLIDAGHIVDIYADCRSGETLIQPDLDKHRLLERTTWMDMPPEAAPWEMPVWPLTGRTWPPGAEKSILNCVRFARAVPAVVSTFLRHPALTCDVLKAANYGYQAHSLSGLYRLRKLSSVPECYDVLHAHFGPVAKSFRFARELWKAPLVASFHGYDFCTVPRKEGPHVYEKLFQVADRVIANSDYTRQQLLKLGCAADRIRYLPVGLNVDEFAFSERRLQPNQPTRVITVGRLVEIKGHEWVIRAVAQLRDVALRRSSAAPPLHPIAYDIVGDGPLRPKLQQLVTELGLADVVKFHGGRTTADVRALMQEAHIFALCSVSIEGDCEGQGLVVQEAQASGMPVVVTQHGALPAGLLDNVSGYIVPERDVNALAERLLFLAMHPELWPEMGRRGRKFVEENYDMPRLTGLLINLYREAVKGFK